MRTKRLSLFISLLQLLVISNHVLPGRGRGSKVSGQLKFGNDDYDHRTNFPRVEPPCYFGDDCKLVKRLLSEEFNCIFLFNNSECNVPPIFITNNNVNLSKLTDLAKTYKQIFNWSLMQCDKTMLYSGRSDLDCNEPTNPKIDDFDKALGIIADMYRSRKNPGSKSNSPSKTEVIVLAVVSTLAIIMFVVVLVLGVLLYRKKRSIRDIRRGRHARQRGAGIHQIDPIEQNDYVNDITGLEALCRLFHSEGLELPREAFDIGNIRDSTANIIGVGEFSIVFKGLLKPQGRTVAVKTQKSGQGTAKSIKAVLKECRILMECGKHRGVMRLLGVCTENFRKGEVFVVLEHCEKGSLKSALVQNRSYFTNLVKDGELKKDEDLKKLAARSIEDGPPTKFNTFQLFKWGWQVADAMEYLAMRKIVHVSLSARNVMLNSDYNAKVSDFRLAKMPREGSIQDSSSRTYTIKEKNIPWRWLAVESLLDDIFSTESDVWTFGIFLWELFTLGATPYPEHYYGGEFTMCLKHGFRLLKPELTTIECYELMLICWFDAPEKRPTFTKLKTKLQGMIPATPSIK